MAPHSNTLAWKIPGFPGGSNKKAKWLSEEALQIAVKEKKQKAKEKMKDISI